MDDKIKKWHLSYEIKNKRVCDGNPVPVMKRRRDYLDTYQYIEYLYRWYWGVYPIPIQIQRLANRSKKELKSTFKESPKAKNLTLFREYLKQNSAKFKLDKFKDIHDETLGIKYYGEVGVSGYANSTRDYLLSLYTAGNELGFYLYSNSGVDKIYLPEDISLLTSKEKLEYFLFERDIFYTHIIIHGMPQPQWKSIIKKEKELNPDVKIIGLTVWESDTLPYEWKEYLELCDKIIVPNYWNQLSFSSELTRPVEVVHNPIDVFPESIDYPLNIFNDKYIFYTIGEWITRKNLPFLIEAFKSAFHIDDKVVLYIKTNSKHSKEVLEKLIENRANQIIIDTNMLSEKQIMSIHEQGDCFVSPCKAEGTGLGACTAAYYNNPVIMTSGAGQMDYLKGIYYISSITEYVKACDPLVEHAGCKGGVCIDHPYFKDTHLWHQPLFDDLVSLLRMVYKFKPKASPITKQFLLEEMNIRKIGLKFTKVIS